MNGVTRLSKRSSNCCSADKLKSQVKHFLGLESSRRLLLKACVATVGDHALPPTMRLDERLQARAACDVSPKACKQVISPIEYFGSDGQIVDAPHPAKANGGVGCLEDRHALQQLAVSDIGASTLIPP